MADEVLAHCEKRVQALSGGGLSPKLALVVVGDDPASHSYVARKQKACAKIGVTSQLIHLPADTTQEKLRGTIESLNRDPSCHAILLQLPLPPHMEPAEILALIDPAKDVDGLHPDNLGLLAAGVTGQPVACTPQGIMLLLEHAKVDIAGANAVVIGRSRIVGRPMALLLANASATVTICHSKTSNLAQHCKLADILVVACGVPAIITGDMVKPGSCVIDVGISKGRGGGIEGDVEASSVGQVCGLLTPMPLGVGPLTVAMLMQNACLLAERSIAGGHSMPALKLGSL